jgi:hypothetical protein
VILGIALWKSDVGPRLGFPEVSGLPGQRGRPSWKSPRKGRRARRGGVSEGMGWPQDPLGRVSAVFLEKLFICDLLWSVGSYIS